MLAFDQSVEVPGLGKVNFDLAYGGAFYAYVNAEKLGLDLVPENYNLLIRKGMDIKKSSDEKCFENNSSF